MSSSPVGELIEVRKDPDGAIVIGSDPIGAAGLITLALTSGVLVVDPMTPNLPPQLRLSEANAVDLVVDLFGVDVAKAVVEVEYDGESVSPRMATSVIAESLVRLAVLRWLGDRSPYALPREFLLVEELSLSATLADYLDPDHAAPEELLDWRTAVVDWSRRARKVDSPFRQAPQVLPALRRALVELNQMSPSTGEASDAIRHELELLAAMDVWGVVGGDLGPPLRAVGSLVAQPAPPSVTDQLSWQGQGAVDWDKTPAASTSRAETAVSWRVDPEGEGHALTVLVDPAPVFPHAQILSVSDAPRFAAVELQASLHDARWPLPLVVARLQVRPESRAWMGNQSLDLPVMERVRSASSGQLSVEIQSLGGRRAPRSGSDAQRAAALRWTCRGLASLRLGRASEGTGHRRELLNISKQQLVLGAQLYDSIGQNLASAMCRAVLPRAGEVGFAAHRRESWPSVPAEQILGFEPLPLAGPGAVTASEAWLAASSRTSLEM